VAAISVRLADGGVWGLGLPTIRYQPRFESLLDEFGRCAENVKTTSVREHSHEVSDAVERLSVACESGVEVEMYDAFLNLAAALIRRVHEIDQSAALDLLDVPDQALPALVEAVVSATRTGYSSTEPGAPVDGRQ
jgi:hypothetical protein